MDSRRTIRSSSHLCSNSSLYLVITTSNLLNNYRANSTHLLGSS
jgi:hypothetical protein